MELAARYGPWGLVAGASVGLGSAFAEELARRGLNVVTLARRGRVLAEEATRLRDTYGVEVRPVEVDLARPDFAARVDDATRGVDVGMLICNAAAAPTGPFLEVSLDEHLRSIAVNCVAPTVLSHRFGPGMAARGRGALVLVTSAGALQGGPVFTSYFAGKAYDWILAEGLWSELGEHGVDVVGYMVGATATPDYERSRHARAARAGDGTDGSEPGATESRIRNPSSPADVAARLFETLERGPTTFSHPGDERHMTNVGQMSRADAVRSMGRLIRAYWG